MTPYYDQGGITLYHGDFRIVLPQLVEPVDIVLTDPPFSEYTHANAKSNRSRGYGNKAIDFQAIDFQAISLLLAECGRLCNRWFISTMDWRHIAQLERTCPAPWEFVRFGVWVKTNPMPQISSDRPANGWDGIVYLHSSASSKWWNGGGSHGNWIGPVITNGAHPTGKPVDLFASLVKRFTNDRALILDPFTGSGTTLVASKRYGRRAIGIELEERYCEVAAKRLEGERLTLFESYDPEFLFHP